MEFRRVLFPSSDVGMSKAGGYMGFIFKPVEQIGLMKHLRVQHFDSHHPVEIQIPGTIDNSHPAFTQVFFKLVVSDSSACHDYTVMARVGIFILYDAFLNCKSSKLKLSRAPLFKTYSESCCEM